MKKIQKVSLVLILLFSFVFGLGTSTVQAVNTNHQTILKSRGDTEQIHSVQKVSQDKNEVLNEVVKENNKLRNVVNTTSLANDSPEVLSIGKNGAMYYGNEPLFVGEGNEKIPANIDELMKKGVPKTLNLMARASAGAAAIEYHGQVSYGNYGTIVGDFTVNGKQAFCLQHPKATPGTGTPNNGLEPYANPNIARILYYGWGGPGNIFGTDRARGIVVTSLVLSKYYNGDISETTTLPGWTELDNLAQNGTIPGVDIQINNKSDAVLNVNFTNNKQISESATFNATKDNYIDVSIPVGITFVNETTGENSTNKKVRIYGEQKFHLEADAKYTNNYNSGKQSGNVLTFQPLVVRPLESGYQDIGTWRWYDDPTKTVSFSAKFFARTGNFELIKKDKTTGKTMSNITFSIKVGTADWKDYTTDTNGKISIKDVVHDTVIQYKEKSAPAGYVLDTKTYEAKVVAGETITHTRENNIQLGTFSGIKYEELYGVKEQTAGTNYQLPDYNFKPAEGVEFQLEAYVDVKHPDGTVKWKKGDVIEKNIKTAKDGSFAATTKLYPGTHNVYLLKETKNPKDGYRPPNASGKGEDKQAITFSIPYAENPQNEGSSEIVIPHSKNVYNLLKSGNWDLNKVHFSTSEQLADAEFLIEGMDPLNKSVVFQFKTTGKSLAKDLKLIAGRYKVTETKYPNGFEQAPGESETRIIEIKDDQTTQTIWSNKSVEPIVPMIGTLATNKADGLKLIDPVSGITLVDEVKYANLTKNVSYTLKGVLMDKSTNSPLLVNGKQITASKSFTAKEENGTEKLEFKLDATGLNGHELVVFETLYDKDGKEIASHKEIHSVEQTITVIDPEIGTKATNKADGLQEAEARKKVTIADVVSYKNLLIGKEYEVKGKLMDKATEKPLLVGGKEVTASKKFTPKNTTGTVTLEYTLDASELAGQSIVVFEDVYREGKLIGSHSDINDLDQTIKFKNPEIKTMATNALDGTKAFWNEDNLQLKDTVSYKDLIVGKTYTLKGVLMNKATKKPFLVKDKEVRSEVTFLADRTDGTVEMIFNLSASAVKENTELVVFENLYRDNELVVSHEDINDKDQTVKIYVPEVSTSAKDKETGTNEAHPLNPTTIIDTVMYKNLIPGNEYTVKGILMDKETNEPLLIDENPVTAEKTFVAKQPNGSIDLEFTFDGSSLRSEIVVFESVYYEDKEVTAHTDIEDENQTIKFVDPLIHTTAFEKETELKEVKPNEKLVIVDRIAHKGLMENIEYHVKGILMDKATEKPLEVNGKVITSERKVTLPLTDPEEETDKPSGESTEESTETSTSDSGKKSTKNSEEATEESGEEGTEEPGDGEEAAEYDGHFELEFELDASLLAEKEIVVYEEVYHNDRLIVDHKDINDEGQTVRIIDEPAIKTTAFDQASESKHPNPFKQVTIVDTINYSGLTPGREYTMKGVLMSKATGEPVEIDGKKVENELTFTPKLPEGSVRMTFTLDARTLAGEEIVVFEDLYSDNELVVSHADLDDEDQTVEFLNPEIHTTATEKDTEMKLIAPKEKVVITDKVQYRGLRDKTEHVMKGILMDKATEQPLLVNGKQVTAETTFTVDLSKDEETEEGEGQEETDKPTEESTEESTESSTSTSSTGSSENSSESSEKKVKRKTKESETATLETTESSTVDSTEGTADSSGTEEESEEVEKPLEDQYDGVVELDFEIDASQLGDKEVVVYEEVYEKEDLVAEHKDINDDGQTVKFVDEPEIRTTAVDKETNSKTPNPVRPVTIVDTVEYAGLTPGKEYTLKGKLMDKSTGSELKVNGKSITAEVVFTPNKPSGKQIVEFTFDGTSLGGKEVVVFEDLYAEKELVVSHADLEDENQTVKFNEKDPEGEKDVEDGKKLPQTGFKKNWDMSSIIKFIFNN